MAKVLLGWEMGSGLGHFQNLIPLYRGLKDNGHQPVLAVRSLNSVRHFKEVEADVFQAPYVIGTKPVRHTYGYADILDGSGWSEREVLKLMTMAWQSIIKVVKPALVITDYSPCLNLAAFKRVPTVVLGIGFTLLPNRNPLPPMRPWEKELHPNSLKTQREVEATMGQVCQDLDISPPAHLGEIFHAYRSYVLCLPLLDPYAAHRDDPHMPNISPAALEPFGDIRKKRGMFFAYLDGHFGPTRNIMELLSKLKLPSEAYVKDLSPQMKKKYSSNFLKIHDGPQPLDYIFKNFRALIHHGGMMGQDAAAAALPQLVLPKQAEQNIIARLLADAGVAIGIPTNRARDINIVKKGLDMFLNTPRWDKAQALASRIRQEYEVGAMENILQDCLDTIKDNK